MRPQHFNTTAVLIFANSKRVDALRKGIPHGNRLFGMLNEEIVSKVKNTGLPYFLYSEERQIGMDFGERFTAAIQTIFDRGFTSIITVGNDTPNLSSATIECAYKNVKAGKTVIGPSFDGGFYLLGLHKSQFKPASFKALPWQHHHLFREAVQHFSQNTKLYTLQRLNDIDTKADIQKVVQKREYISSYLFELLLSILSTALPKRAYFAGIPIVPNYHQLFNKGSPHPIF